MHHLGRALWSLHDAEQMEVAIGRFYRDEMIGLALVESRHVSHKSQGRRPTNMNLDQKGCSSSSCFRDYLPPYQLLVALAISKVAPIRHQG